MEKLRNLAIAISAITNEEVGIVLNKRAYDDLVHEVQGWVDEHSYGKVCYNGEGASLDIRKMYIHGVSFVVMSDDVLKVK